MDTVPQEEVNANSNKSVQEDWWQPLLFAPDELLLSGMQDAHSHPLVGRRDRDGVISWRESPLIAWSRGLIEMARTGNSYAAMIFDCDSRASVEIAASACVGTGPVPPPNFASARKASGHFQCGWFLRDPVHRGASARAKPLAFLGRVSEFYRAALQADPGFVGVLSYNPVHGDYSTTYPRENGKPYALDELASYIPRGWRIPKLPTTGVGRNCALFRALYTRGLKDTERELEGIAHSLNSRGPGLPLPDSEVRGILRSVYRYRVQWRAKGHEPWWIARQSRLGRAGGLKSGEARRAAVLERDLRIVVMLDAGLSQREVAAVVGVSRRTVRTARERLARGVGWAMKPIQLVSLPGLLF